jgi:hypothetical protein
VIAGGSHSQVEAEEGQCTHGTEAMSGMDCQTHVGRRGNRDWDIFKLNIFVMLSCYFPDHIILSVLKPIAAKIILLRVSHCTQKIIFIVFCQVIAVDKNVSG